MWRWEQGRLPYFQFDALRRIAQFALTHDWKTADFGAAEAEVGLPFDPQKAAYRPWRNYQRVFRDMLICSEIDGVARPTALAATLAEPGLMTSDEYFHILAMCHTDPSLAARDWSLTTPPRFPLLFSLKYLLLKAKVTPGASASFNEVIGAYLVSGFSGGENADEFCALLDRADEFENAVDASGIDPRQARESLLVLQQISYLSASAGRITVSLHPDDASDGFGDLPPIAAPFLHDRDEEVQRRASLFADGSHLTFLDFPRTVISECVEAGFAEGSRVKRTHLVVERNSQLRREFVRKFDPKTCDVCALDTSQSYPWTQGVIDVHHKLPLASGTRSGEQGTILEDLVALCPNCHRAVHRFYEQWLKDRSQKDFRSITEANTVYEAVKAQFPGAIHV